MEDTVILMKQGRSCHSRSKPPKTSRPASSALTVQASAANHISCLSLTGSLQILKQARHSPRSVPLSHMLTPHLQIWSHAMSSKSLIVNGGPDYKRTQHSHPASCIYHTQYFLTDYILNVSPTKPRVLGSYSLGVLPTENSAWQREGSQFVFVEWKNEERSRDYKRRDSEDKSD